MKLKKGKWIALTVAVLMGMSAFTSVSADEETKEYTTNSIDGKASLWHTSDSLKKAKVYKGVGQYEFTTNAIVNAKVIDGTSGDVNIKADGKILTFNMTGPIGISSYGKRGYSADGNYPDLSNVTVTAKKLY